MTRLGTEAQAADLTMLPFKEFWPQPKRVRQSRLPGLSMPLDKCQWRSLDLSAKGGTFQKLCIYNSQRTRSLPHLILFDPKRSEKFPHGNCFSSLDQICWAETIFAHGFESRLSC